MYLLFRQLEAPAENDLCHSKICTAAKASLGWALFGIAPQQEAMQARLGWTLFGRLGWALFGIVPQQVMVFTL